jgi:endonuclease/exonuclease/phosphatase family metal-dependent hydrolase
MNLSVVLYNVFLTVPVPLRFSGQVERARLIPDIIGKINPDVVVFAELIAPSCRKIVLDGLEALGWKYCSDPISVNVFFSKFKAVSGGVVVASKYPIIAQQNFVFEGDCAGHDCSACKGLVYCRILKDNNVFNVIGSHFQAWTSAQSVSVRISQAKEAKAFIDSLRISSDEPLVFAADFNVDRYVGEAELETILGIIDLQAIHLDVDAKLRFSTDPSTNQLVGNDDDEAYKSNLFPKGCYESYVDSLSCECCPRELLDHISFSKSHVAPVKCSLSIVQSNVEPFEIWINATTTRTVTDVSDHYPLLAILEFAQTSPFGDREIRSSLPPQANRIHPPWLISFVIAGALAAAAVILLVTAVVFSRTRKAF